MSTITKKFVVIVVGIIAVILVVTWMMHTQLISRKNATYVAPPTPTITKVAPPVATSSTKAAVGNETKKTKK